MALFRYNNYRGDLLLAPDWKPHDSWDQHYSGPGFDDRDQQLEDYLSALAVTEWTSVTGGIGFTNGWVDFNGTQTVQYRKVGDVVELRGLMKSGTVGLSAFTLPAGFHPSRDMTFPVLTNGVLGYISIGTDGTTPMSGSNVYMYLDGIRFSTVA